MEISRRGVGRWKGISELKSSELNTIVLIESMLHGCASVHLTHVYMFIDRSERDKGMVNKLLIHA